MDELIGRGGPLVWLLLGSLVIAVTVFLERLFYYHRSSMNTAEFISGIASLIRRKNYAEAMQECVATRVPVGRVMHAVLLRHHAPREHLKEIAQEAGQLEVPRLENHLMIISAVAHGAPLIGLLGTMVGLLDSFTGLSAGSLAATPADVARGVYNGLTMAALGIGVAIPAYIFHSYLVAKARYLMHDIERAGVEVINLIEDSRVDNSRIVSFATPQESPVSNIIEATPELKSRSAGSKGRSNRP
ncbi:MAG: MotA/TolQ/ExbB proton channel family protein [Verrucomicrobiaceae bacterium]|nr:MotA/TolQ/ExbB proton channel family protein [Verrucomicrobiaceae bacterium]